MEERVDKYLFAMRIYKTRSIAADACKKGRITMKGVELKPSRTFKIGDKFSVRKGPITYSYEVLRLSENRLGAKLVPDYMRDITAPDQLELLELARLAGKKKNTRKQPCVLFSGLTDFFQHNGAIPRRSSASCQSVRRRRKNLKPQISNLKP